jgi:exodeoxyribonuclease-5
LPNPSQILRNKFPHTPTAGQEQLFEMMDDFIDGTEARQVLLLKGYAGTGKTSMVSLMVQVLPLFNLKYFLLAPTGRAAKVMANYSKKVAFTIHKIIYKSSSDKSGNLKFKRQRNYAKDTVFIVDEASMLAESNDFGKTGLLTDLINYVFENPTNRLILVGDGAQLPPVGQALSPALEKGYMESNFHTSVKEVLLTDVMRQGEGSGILKNATAIRNALGSTKIDIQMDTKSYKDIFRMTGQKMEEGIRYAYDKYGMENAIIICRSNFAANQYNEFIRRNIHFYEEEIEAGDVLMIVKNNYYYVPQDTPGGFLANGDFAVIEKIVNLEERYGFRFATLQLKLMDYPDQDGFEAKVMLDTLHVKGASLPYEDIRRMQEAVAEDYADMDNQKKRNEAIRDDPYLNALQIKFAYALTCHKSQGGQWKAIFVDQGYLPEDKIDEEYVRWLYTAVTRATEELFLLNFKPNFFC